MLTRITIAALAAGALGAIAAPAVAQAPSDAERAQAEAEAERERAAAEEREALRQLERERALAEREAQRQLEHERAQAERRRERERAEAERERAMAEAHAEREQAQAERERMREQLERAKAELEAAAREVARLSSELTAPAVRAAMQNVRFAQQRAMLGIGTEDDPNGVRVTAVTPNGPAARAGIRAGDVIVAIDGAALPTGETQSPSAALLAQMEHVRGGETVALELRGADGAMRTVQVQTRTLGESFWWPGEDFDFDFDFDFGWGDGERHGWFWQRGAEQAWRSMELTELTPGLGAYFGTDRGVLVVRGPNREGYGLQDGDVILDIGGRQPTSPEHAMRILRSFEPGETLRMTIMRHQRRETLEVQLPVPEQRPAAR